MNAVLERQGIHALALGALLGAAGIIFQLPGFADGSYWGVSTTTWFLLSLLLPALHQVYVALAWRFELHHRSITRRLGPDKGFAIYGAAFMALLILRALVLIPLALSNRGTLPISAPLRSGLAVVAGAFSLYVVYSVARYFSFRRAMGADHFDPAFRTRGLERRGAFKYVRNAMYTLGLLALWIPGLAWASRTALLAAAFQHSYIWVHYFTVEKPDMERIYGQETAA